MALDIDGFATLRTIVSHAASFPDGAAEAAKAARSIVAKQLKAKGLTLPGLRRVAEALGPETFALIVDGLSDADQKSIAGKVDKHHPELKIGSADWRRGLIRDLSAGRAEATPKAAKAPKAGKAPAAKPRVKRALSSKAMAAVWDGKDRDG